MIRRCDQHLEVLHIDRIGLVLNVPKPRESMELGPSYDLLKEALMDGFLGETGDIWFETSVS